MAKTLRDYAAQTTRTAKATDYYDWLLAGNGSEFQLTIVKSKSEQWVEFG